VCKDLIGIWYDTVKYNMEMVHNQEGDPYEYQKLNLRIASVLEDKADRYNKKILFFEPRSGKISKVIDFKKQNPYSKSKEPRLDENLKYNSEYDHIPPIDEKGKKLEINKFISLDYGGWRGDFVVWCFSELALTKSKNVIDEWNTFMVFDSLGNTIMNHEFNEPTIRYEINGDGSYFLIEIAIEGWKHEGFCIFDIKNKKEAYRYILTDFEYKAGKYMNGAGFCENGKMATGVISFADNKDLSHEFIMIDIPNLIEYKYLFSNQDMKEIMLNWGKKYKTCDSLLNFFSFKSRKF
jgi:hypothetical protein